MSDPGLLERVKRRLVGPPDRIPQRALLVVIFVALTVAAAGAYLAATRGLETGGSSLPVLRPILVVATSTLTWVVGLVILLRRFLVFRDRRYAEQAADVVGYQPRSVRRLSYEAKDSDGSTRVIAQSGDEPSEIEERILAALAGADDDRIKLNPEAFADDSPDQDDLEGQEDDSRDLGDDAERFVELELRAEELDEEIDARLDEILSADLDLAKLADAEEDRVAPIELLDEETTEEVAEVEALIDELEAVNEEMMGILERHEPEPVESPEPDPQDDVEDSSSSSLVSRVTTAGRSLVMGIWSLVVSVGKLSVAAAIGAGVWHILVTIGPTLGLGLLSKDVLEMARETWVYVAVSVAFALAIVAAKVAASRRSAGGSADGPDAVEEFRDTWREEWKLMKLDLAATLSFRDVGWNLLLPAAVASFLLLLVVQFWVSAWFYPVIGAIGILVGVVNYLRVGRKRSRRLEALRADREGIRFADMAIHVKAVEVPETTLYYAWIGDAEPRRYVHDDREEFAADVADRAYEILNGIPVSPSVMEKQAAEIEQMRPDLAAFRDAELEQIMERLLATVEERDMVPKAKLIEDVVEHDMSSRRFGPGRKGQGHDPALVREAYRDLVPAAIVEQEIDVSRDEDEEETVTGVRLRSDPLPPEYGEVRAQFASSFRNYARWDPLYELPDVSDRLDEDPTYADSLGARGESA